LAVKVIDLRRLRLSGKADREFKKLQREVDILKRVPEHPNLVRFVDAIEHGNWFLMVMELVQGGDLFSVLMRRASGAQRPRFNAAEAAWVLRQLVDGLGFLHEHGVIHRDLKLENVLVTKEWQDGSNRLCEVKITDFGLSKVVGEGLSDARSTVGSPRYIAPEVLSNGVHDFRADLWSLGILFYVLLAGRFPADGLPDVQQSVLDQAIEQLDVSKDAKAVLSGLLQVDREKRTTLAELQLCPLLASCSSLDGPAPPVAKKPRREAPAPKAVAAPKPEAPKAELPVESSLSLFGSMGSLELVESVDVQELPPTPEVLRSPNANSMPPDAVGEEEVVPICELDRAGGGKAVQGTIVLKCDHKLGGGFHIRVRDATGLIDVHFREGAARRFKSDPSLGRGSLLRLAGFTACRVLSKDQHLSVPGRLHQLNYDRAEDVRFEVVPVTVT